MFLLRYSMLLLIATVSGLSSGCSLHPFGLKRGRDAYRQTDLKMAAARLWAMKRDFGMARLFADLDLAVVALTQGAPGVAASHLLYVKSELLELQERRTELIDDGLGGYLNLPRPQPYETVMIDNLLAICAFAIGRSDAADYAVAAQKQLASWTEGALAMDPSFTATMDDLPQPALFNYVQASSPSDVQVNALAVSAQEAETPYCLVNFHEESGEEVGELRLFAMVGESPEIVWTKQVVSPAERELALAYAVATHQAAVVREYLAVVETVETPSLPVPARACPHLQLYLDAPTPENAWGETTVLVNVRELADWQFKHASSLTTPQALVEQAYEELGPPAMIVSLAVNDVQALYYHMKRSIIGPPTFRRGPEMRWALMPLQIQGFTGKLPLGKHTLQIGLNDGGHVVTTKSIDIEIKSEKPTTVTVVAPNEVLYVAAN